MSQRDPRGPGARDPSGRDQQPGGSAARPRPTPTGAPPARSDRVALPRERAEPAGGLTGDAAGPSPRRPPAASRPSLPRDPYADPYSDDELEARPSGRSFGRGAARPAANAETAADDPTSASAWLDSEEEWDETLPEAVEPDEAPPARRPGRPPRSAGPARARTRARARSSLPTLRVPSFLAGADLAGDRVALGLLGAGILSLLLMAFLLASQLGRLPPSLVIHLDAAGVPDRWGPPRVLWRIPLLAAMTTLINLVIAWRLAPIDRFSSRFLLAAALVVQLLAWVAIFDFL